MTTKPLAEPKVRIIKASKYLQVKAGTGPLDKEKVRLCQEIIDFNTIDFLPLAQQYLKDIGALIAEARGSRTNRKTEERLELMRRPVMELKANAAIFHYPLAGHLATIMLGFLESIEKLDSEALEIAEAHQQAQNLIVTERLRGDGGETGYRLEQELKDACKRYFNKNSIEPKDAFYVEF